eukprot:g65110.t1
MQSKPASGSSSSLQEQDVQVAVNDGAKQGSGAGASGPRDSDMDIASPSIADNNQETEEQPADVSGKLLPRQSDQRGKGSGHLPKRMLRKINPWLDDMNEEWDELLQRVQWRRTKYRACVLALTLGLIVGLCMTRVGKLLKVRQHVYHTVTLDPAKGPWELQLDHCAATLAYTDLIAPSAGPFQLQIDASFRRSQNAQIEVRENFLSVQDARQLTDGHKYQRYECRVAVTVPRNRMLPSTHLTVLGFEYTSLYARGVKWDPASRLSVDIANKRRVNIFLDFEDCHFGEFVASAVWLGSLSFVDATFASDITVGLEASSANLYVRALHDLEVRHEAAVQKCLTGDAITVNSSTKAILRYREGTVDSDPPTLTVTGTGYLHVMCAQSASNFTSSEEAAFLLSTTTLPATSYQPTGAIVPNLSAFATAAIARAKKNRDLSLVEVAAPGSPSSVWQFSIIQFYTIFPYYFLDVFSWSVLTPKYETVKVDLQPAFCPGLQWSKVRSRGDYSFQNVVMLADLLEKNLGEDFLVYSQKQDKFSATGGKYRIMKQDRQKEQYPNQRSIFELRLQDNVFIIVLLAVEVAGTLILSGYVVYLAFRSLYGWAQYELSRWGRAQYGKAMWKEKRAELTEGANIFFWSEFLVAPPSQIHTYKELTLTVWAHLFFLVLLPEAFLLIFQAIVYRSPAKHRHRDLFLVLAGLCSIVVSVFTLFSVFSLFIYYLGLSTKKVFRLWVGRLHMFLFAFTVFVSTFYFLNVCVWIMLGVAMKPGLVLPILATIFVIAMQFSNMLSRVRKLYNELHDFEMSNKHLINMNPELVKLDKNNQVVVPGSVAGNIDLGDGADTDDDDDDDAIFKEENKNKVEKVQIADIQKANAADVLMVLQKSQFLEVAGASLLERLWAEIVKFLSLVFTLLFFGIGFYVLSSGQDFVSAVTTGTIFLFGRGLTIPVDTHDEDKRRFAAMLRRESKKAKLNLKEKQKQS